MQVQLRYCEGCAIEGALPVGSLEAIKLWKICDDEAGLDVSLNDNTIRIALHIYLSSQIVTDPPNNRTTQIIHGTVTL